LGRRA
jgi:hypothetical protein